MKFSVVVETRKKVKRDWVVNGLTEYIVRIPNYVSVNTDLLANAVKKKLEHTVMGEETKVVSYHMYGDAAYTAFEKNQLDFGGTATKPLELAFDKLDLTN